MRYPLLLSCLLTSTALQAQVFVCPLTAQEAGAEWQRFTPEAPDPGLPVIELYAGDPRQGGTLIASDSVERIGVSPLDWTLAGQPSLHMACTFAGGDLRLVRPLPAGLGYCVADNEFADAHAQLECR